ncbi:enhancer of polycomb homolog 1 [Diabrotica virgifera virgifera]|uniref:Enhancer of polycomb-like protein n=1 Tax=Diabrotica virgifera virgifera TaxID=50390 RepID=A0A6P7G063_DIAVI|nr:enhancer of polycomb homolog 1 [Diabrotica virgifera virgifera]XP_028142189.1 enhancer of polycomb homolog 1 [Diabrotica virgifera virgifera]XP_028142191.1 enhancer of polycomb homolog 1 [Diabrotica virgifera virgifera]XP_028142192.1 enhancer of polycomb homolog 1 [Diabrotica virgifera virgifera]XP_050499737.1 enhancer of polycomb homolog 1 [Diabrotica virgifera virgifera]
MSKLSFRARALDASKPMPIYMAEELPDLPDYSAINRAVPQMPSGMQKEEECEHHLQRAIVAGLIIPTPEVSELPDKEFYEKVYPANYKQPRQLIHMQPFTMEQDIPDYDMDSDDERWLQAQTQKLDLSPVKFEEMMDRLEKSSGQTVVTLNEAKALLKEDDDLIIAVFDYWLNKRLKTQHPLILTVKTEIRSGTAANNPYLAFRRRTEKMQTRKNRKNDEASYEKMLKLRRDLYRAVTLLELVKRREKIKREYVHLTVEVFEKRFQAKDFSGAVMAEASAIKSSRPAFTPIFHNHYPNQSWANKSILKDEVIPRREKRQYKKRKHKSLGNRSGGYGVDSLGGMSSDDEVNMSQLSPEPEEAEDESQFAFKRNKLCSYHRPLSHEGNWRWASKEENGSADKRFRFTLTSLSNPRRCIGFARRRVGRGGRIILDRISTNYDDFWRTLDFSITEPDREAGTSRVVEEEPALVQETDIKSEVSVSNSARISDSSVISDSIKVEIKKEPEDVQEEGVTQLEPVYTKEENDDMVDFLRSLRRDWLHFRPKTPPPDYEVPCDMLHSEETFFDPSANTFSMEIQTLDAPSSTFLDTSTFVSDPFTLDQLDLDSRQLLPAASTLNTLIPSVSSDSNENDNFLSSDSSSSDSDFRTIGCSNFKVNDLGLNDSNVTTSSTMTKSQQTKVQYSSTSASPKVNSVNTTSSSSGEDFKPTRGNSDSSLLGNTNGLLSQFCFDVPPSRTKNNKLQYAYSGAMGYPNASSGTLSLHTSAHTLTLNSHSANILDIPLTNDTETNKIDSEATGGPVSSNNKSKSIVRKNNIIMEVT